MKTAQEIFNEASLGGISAAAVAIRYGMAPQSNMWPEMQELQEKEQTYSDISLTSEARTDLLTRYALAVADSVQFPRNTSFMHLIGCVASAMTRNFTVDYHSSELPIAMYIVTSQPPSSGKTAVNNAHCMPIKFEFDRISEKAKKERGRLFFRIEELKKQLKDSTNANEKNTITDEIVKIQEKIAENYIITYPLTDATPEAIQTVASDEGGVFNVISDEATALNTSLGISYGSESGKSNAEVVLKGWDGGFVGTARVGRGVAAGYIVGNISVIAQDESIDAILSAGERGNGLTERFLMLRESPMIGKRSHWDSVNDRPAYKPVPVELKAEYARFVHSLVEASQVKLRLSRDSSKLLALLRDRWEENFLDGGKWEHALLRGAMGKADKHITRMAAIFHVADQWCDGGKRSAVIEEESMSRAIAVYDALTRTFTDAVESSGYAGEKSEMEVIADKLRKHASSGKTKITVKSVYDSVKKIKPFKGIPQVYSRIKDKVIPMLEEKGYCVCYKGYIYINPGMK